MEDLFLPYNLTTSAYHFFLFQSYTIFSLSHYRNDISALFRLRSSASITTLTLKGHYYGKKAFLYINTTLTQRLIPTARTLEEERDQVLGESVGTVAKVNETSNGRIWASEFNCVAARTRLGRVSKLTNRLFL
jgi:hypothetical protein